MTSTAHAPDKSYQFDNRNESSRAQHVGLSALLDEFTTRRISDLIDPTGKRCLEVAAGGGSIAVWLAERVGPQGSVLATDLHPLHIPRHERLAVLQHDLVNEPAPKGGEFDLIHARIVLNQLPERREIIHQLVGRLAPAGILLIEEWDATNTDIVVAAPTPEAAELYRLYQETIGKILSRAGTDRFYARKYHAVLMQEGLTNVDTYVSARNWTGGSDAAKLNLSGLVQLRQQFLDNGITEAQLAEMKALMENPRLVVNGHLLFSTSGQRPA